MKPHRRPLAQTERRALQAKIHGLQARSRRAKSSAIPTTAAIIGVLWLLTMVASDAPWWVITAFWLVVGAGLTLWLRRDMRGHANDLSGMAQALESALRRNEADVYDIRARRFAELEEIEDEGACYAFELDALRLVFIAGQEFYDAAKFPSLDFSLVDVLDEAGRPIDTLIEKRGRKTAPARTIPSAIKATLSVPDHLETRTGTLEDLEKLLSAKQGV